MSAEIRPSSLDHVALWVDERKPLASFLCDHLGMHVIEETDTFTLVGVDAKLGKLTLFDAEGPRERGVARAHRAARRRPRARRSPACRRAPRCGRRDGRSGALRGARAGCRWRWSQRGGIEFDLDHVRAAAARPRGRAAPSSRAWASSAATAALAVGDRELRIVEGEAADGERPLLNHIALLVDSADEVQRDAEQRGVEIDDVKDAPNTLAVFLRGPSGVRIEYVEHKPGFALV